MFYFLLEQKKRILWKHYTSMPLFKSCHYEGEEKWEGKREGEDEEKMQKNSASGMAGGWGVALPEVAG